MRVYFLLLLCILALCSRLTCAKEPIWRRLVKKWNPFATKETGQASESEDGSSVDTAAELDSEIPIIDISGLVGPEATVESKKSVAAEIIKACEEIGFFIIKGHHVRSDIIDNMWTATSDFFDLSTEYKDTWTTTNEAKYPFGYSGIGAEVLSAGKDAETKEDSKSLPDLKELFSLGPSNPDSGFPTRVFPGQPSTFEEAWTVYYDELAELAAKIMRGFAIGLGKDEFFFDQFLTHHASAVRALNYPAYEGYEAPPGQLRASAHTDYGTITILKSGGPGLQVSKDEVPPRWVDAPFVEDAFIVNLGDLMRRWSNDEWKSTLHRVVNPENPSQWARRQSIAFFHNPNRDAIIEPLLGPNEQAKHEPIVAGDFLMQKHLSAIQSAQEHKEAEVEVEATA